MKYICKYCGYEIEEDNLFNDDIEEDLWGHIQMNHEDIYENIQDLESPDMIEECYEIIEKGSD